MPQLPSIANETSYAPDVERAINHYQEQLEARKNSLEDRKRDDLNLGITSNFKNFIKYMVALLESQTPDKPVEPDRMAEIVMQFANTHAVQNQTDMMREMRDGYLSAQVMFAADQVGKIAQVKSQFFDYDPQNPPSITYEMPEKADDVDIVIFKVASQKGDDGIPVASFKGEINPGKHEFLWDGRMANLQNQGQTLAAPAGLYRVEIVPRDRVGNPLKDRDSEKQLTVQTWVKGVISGATRDEKNQPAVKIGSRTYHINEILSLESPSKFSSNSREAHLKEKIALYKARDLERIQNNAQDQQRAQAAQRLSYLDIPGL